jgi:hypothetical protein
VEEAGLLTLFVESTPRTLTPLKHQNATKQQAKIFQNFLKRISEFVLSKNYRAENSKSKSLEESFLRKESSYSI